MGTATVLKLTMRPRLCFIISLAPSRQTRNVPVKFVSMIFCAVLPGVSRKWFIEAIPALLRITSSLPYRPAMWDRRPLTSSSRDTSAATCSQFGWLQSGAWRLQPTTR